MARKKNSRKREGPTPPVARPGKTQRIRIHLLVGLFTLIFAGISARLVMLQVDTDLRFAEEDVKHVGEIQIQRPRGDILDRNNRVLATDRMVPSLSANPSKVTNADAMARYLGPILGKDRAWLMERLTRKDKRGNPMKFVWLARRMDDDALARFGDVSDAPDPEALLLQDEPLRYYPEGDLAAQVLGFANREGQGSEGVELRYDEYLRSKPGRRVSRMDSRRNFLGYRTLEYEPPTGGDDVQLTLDAALQFRLEQELDRALEEHNASRAMGILMDPKTGDVLALATRPGFDPNVYMDFSAEERKNRAVMDLFEPGSTFKVVTAAAALQHGLITPLDEIDCMGGRFNPYGHTIRDTHPMGLASFEECFSRSSNIAIIKVAALLGPERLEDWIQRFGFGRRTALGIPGESAGIFRPLRQWSGLSMGSLPMGQEIAVNMLQLAKAFSVIANGGYLVEPNILKKVITAEGSVRIRGASHKPQRILSEETARTMRELCYGVVAGEEGTGSLAAIPEYRVGGKTGTAQIAKPDGTGYYSDRYTAIFAGFAPLNDPRLTCVIVVREPMVRQHYGGYVCGPVFRRVMREALIRLHVPEDPMPDRDWEGILDGLPRTADLDGMELSLFEPGTFEEDFDGLELIPAQEDLTDAGPRFPDFSGMTKHQAKTLAVSLGLPWDPQGAGRVVRQEPAAGTPMQEVRLCKLVFANRPPG